MIFIFNSDVEYITICSSRKYPYPPPHPPWRATEIQRGGGSRRWKFLRGWGGGLLLEVFFPGAQGNIVKLSKPNSCSVEQAISYFAANDLFKQKLLFSSMIFYLPSAVKCFFHILHDK